MKKGKVIFFVILFLIIVITLFLLCILKCHWYGYAIFTILICIVIHCNMFKKSVKQKMVTNIICILLFAINIYVTRPNIKISFIGDLTSRIIDIYMENFDKEAYYTVNEAEWDAPIGYINKTYALSNSAIEILSIESSNHNKIIYQLHGGTYIRPMSNEYRDISLKYSKISDNVDVASLDYRTAPEYVYPAALEDAVEGYKFLLDKGYEPKNIIVVGDSAGGNLAISMIMHLRDNNYALPIGLILMSPWTDFTQNGNSYTYNIYNDVMFGINFGESLKQHPINTIYAGETELTDKYLSNIYGDFDNFPKTLIQVGTYEILESDSKTIYKKAKDSGVDVILSEYEGMFHQFEFYNFIPESKQAWKEVKNFINLVLE